MSARGVLLIALVALGAGFLLGRWGSGATAAEKKSRDSLAVVSKQLDAQLVTLQRQQKTIDSLNAIAVASAAAAVPPARAKTDTIWKTIEHLVPDTGALHDAIIAGKTAVDSERAKSDRHVATLVADTVAKRRAIDEAWAAVVDVRKQRDDAQRQLDAALARRSEPLIGLGAALGPGCVWGAGRMSCGWAGASFGLTVHVRLPRARVRAG